MGYLLLYRSVEGRRTFASATRSNGMAMDNISGELVHPIKEDDSDYGKRGRAVVARSSLGRPQPRRCGPIRLIIGHEIVLGVLELLVPGVKTASAAHPEFVGASGFVFSSCPPAQSDCSPFRSLASLSRLRILSVPGDCP